jgi:ATP-dependent protease Clp ATPase subunit
LIDEIDKSSTDSGPEGRYISGRDVEINLLKLMEESEVAAYIQSDMMSQLHTTVRRKS